MRIRIGDALSRGIEDLMSARGAAILGIYAVFGVVSTVVAFSFVVAILREWSGVSMDDPALAQTALSSLATELPLGVASFLYLGVLLAGLVLSVVAIRSFASESDEPIPMDEVTRDLGGTLLRLFLAQLLVLVLVAIGFVMLFFPALIVAFLLYFTQYAVIIDDFGPVDALSQSLDVVTDNLLASFVLAIVLGGLSGVFSFSSGYLPLPPVTGAIVTTVAGQVVSVFTMAVVTDAYCQATDQRVGGGGAPGAEDLA